MIPSQRYSAVAGSQLLDYLLDEFNRARSERFELEQRWARWQELYRMKPEFERKTFPFEGCSNLVVGLIAADVETIHARIMAMLFTPPNLWKMTALRPEMEDYAPRLEEFMQWAQVHELDAYAAVRDWVMETCKLGTSILKTRYDRQQQKVYEFREVADPMLGGQVRTIEQQVRIMLKDSPKIQHVSISDFYVPSSATTLEDAAWCAEYIRVGWPQLVNRARAGIYANVELVKPYIQATQSTPYELAQQRNDKYVSTRGDRARLVEFWLDWDIDGDGEQEAIVATIHPDSRAMLRVDFNPFFNQQKPYDYARYMTQEKRFYGIGLAEMLEMYQEEVTTSHNQRVDNNTVANAQVTVATKSSGLKQGEPIYPGRMLLVDDINSVKMQSYGTVRTQSTIQDEEHTIALAKQRSGVSDYISGADNASVGYSSATTAVQQLREGAKRVDQTLREFRQGLSGSGLKAVELYQQFNQGGKPFLAMGQKDGAKVQQILQFPLELIRMGVSVDVTATSAAYNKETEIRTNTIIMQMLQQFYMQAVQAMMAALNPQVPPPIRIMMLRAVQGGIILMNRILDDYGIQDADRMLPDLMELLGGQQPQQQPALGGPPVAGAGPGPAQPPPGPGFAPGMAALPGGFGGAPGPMVPQFGGQQQFQ